jgi:hypothetical protein
MGGVCGTCGRQERFIQGFGWESEGKRPFVRPKCKWEDNLNMDLETARSRF